MSHALLSVRVKPRSSRAAIEGDRAGRVLVSVTAAPVEGRANDAVCKLLAKQLGIAPSRLSVQSGKNSRDKLVRIEGMTETEVNRRLPPN